MAILQRKIHNSVTEIYVEGDNWIGYSYPTLYPMFCKRKVLVYNDTLANYKEFTDKGKNTLWNAYNIPSFGNERTLARGLPSDMFRHYAERAKVSASATSACNFNYKTGYYEMNGLKDLSENDMIKIYNCGHFDLVSGEQTGKQNIRTNTLKTYTDGLLSYCARGYLFRSSTMEVIYVGNNAAYFFTPRQFLSMFKWCKKLVTISGGINMQYITQSITEAFEETSLLANIQLKNLRTDIDLHWSPNLTLESLQYLVNNRYTGTTTNITVTVHTDIFKKMTNESAASGDEWVALYNLAGTKNITFAYKDV